MAKKVYDLAVKTGEYKDRNGDTKGRWQNVGAVMQGDDGGKFIMLDRCFNPAGAPNPDNRSTVLLSMFEPREQDGERPARSSGNGNSNGTRQGKPAPADDFADDDIPF